MRMCLIQFTATGRPVPPPATLCTPESAAGKAGGPLLQTALAIAARAGGYQGRRL